MTKTKQPTKTESWDEELEHLLDKVGTIERPYALKAFVSRTRDEAYEEGFTIANENMRENILPAVRREAQLELVEKMIDSVEQYKITNHDIQLSDGSNPVVYFLPESAIDDLKKLLEPQSENQGDQQDDPD